MSNKPLVHRICKECGYDFVPYDETDYLCDDCTPCETKTCRNCDNAFSGYGDMCDKCEDAWIAEIVAQSSSNNSAEIAAQGSSNNSAEIGV